MSNGFPLTEKTKILSCVCTTLTHDLCDLISYHTSLAHFLQLYGPGCCQAHLPHSTLAVSPAWNSLFPDSHMTSFSTSSLSGSLPGPSCLKLLCLLPGLSIPPSLLYFPRENLLFMTHSLYECHHLPDTRYKCGIIICFVDCCISSARHIVGTQILVE